MKLALVSTLALAACGGGTKAPATVGNHTATGGGGASVRDIDWLNRAYDSGEVGSVTVVNGEYEFAMDENGNMVAPDYQPADPDAYVERGSYSVGPPIFGDVDGPARALDVGRQDLHRGRDRAHPQRLRRVGGSTR